MIFHDGSQEKEKACPRQWGMRAFPCRKYMCCVCSDMVMHADGDSWEDAWLLSTSLLPVTKYLAGVIVGRDSFFELLVPRGASVHHGWGSMAAGVYNRLLTLLLATKIKTRGNYNLQDLILQTQPSSVRPRLSDSIPS